MLTIRIENKIKFIYNNFLGKIRSFLLFGSFTKVKFGRRIHLSGNIVFGSNITILENTKIRGKKIKIENDVFIHENVFLRSAENLLIGRGTTINRNACVLDKVTIGEYCSIGPNCVIVGSNHNYRDISIHIKKQGSTIKGIIIENDVWISANVTVIDGVTIGKGAVIAAGAVVNNSVKPYTVVGGIPAKIIAHRS
ncbi:hypothetical protein [uncultured Winogradskyella sp.]|uniref:acyltransferase n=1 Tax=uncultured Winogradskyella sp. TaxID=395353 RepID=UPI0030DA57F6|tara:strand:+ start:642 stop:1226 length:585 start_codon:yes stop_codon:yes gene_type:complete